MRLKSSSWGQQPVLIHLRYWQQLLAAAAAAFEAAVGARDSPALTFGILLELRLFL